MSEIEYHKGKLIPVSTKLDAEETCKHLLALNGFDLDDKCYDSYVQQLDAEMYADHMVMNNIVYVIEDSQLELDEDICNISIDNGVINYEVKFYNGATCMSEMIEDGVKKL